jgi:hypothetical protein
LLVNIKKRLLEEENYVRPTWASISSKKNNSTKLLKAYMKRMQFSVLREISCTDSYIIEVLGKNFNGRKLVTKDQVLGLTKIIWDGPVMEKLMVESLKSKTN